MSVKKPDRPPFQFSSEMMKSFENALDKSFNRRRGLILNANDTLIDPKWLEQEYRSAQTNGVEKKVEEEVKGYNGEWYQGPAPDTYEGEVEVFSGSRAGRQGIDDEQKRIYCYEEDQWGTLRRKFIAQTDNKTVAEWIVAARNGRLVGKNDSEAVVDAAETIESLRAKLSLMARSRDIAAANATNQAARAREAEDKITILSQHLNESQSYARGLARELKTLRERVEAEQNTRMAQIKDAGSRKLRLRTKE